MTKIKQLAEKFYPQVSRIRRHLHANPELSGEEYETAKYVEAQLDELGIPYERVYKTGVVALIKGAKPGKTVLLRGDMDALPIEELADVPYKSKKEGIMHACGHDGHTAGLLGAAMILNELKDELAGNVKLMFQPAEEKGGGALPMIQAGILENPKVDAAFGIHLWGPAPEGKVLYRNGTLMAASDLVEITIKGRGSHAAMPQLSIDPIIIAANVITQFQQIISRNTDPLTPAVISTTTVHGGEALNVICEEVKLGVSIRTSTRELREEIPKQMEAVLKGQALATGCSYRFDYQKLYPPVINSEATNKIAVAAFTKVVGAENIASLASPNMGGEDFAFLGEYVPASYLFVGIAEAGKPEPIHHHPEFAWRDEVLKISSAGLAQVAFDFLMVPAGGGHDEN